MTIELTDESSDRPKTRLGQQGNRSSSGEASEPVRLPGWVRSINAVSNVAAVLAGTTTFIMGLHIIVEAISRSFFNRPLPATLDIVSSWWMVLSIFLALAYTQLRDEHLRVTVITENLPVRLRRRAEILILAVGTVGIGLLSYYAVLKAISASEIKLTSFGTPPISIWPIYIVVAFGLVLLTLQMLVSIYLQFKTVPDVSEGPKRNSGRSATVGIFIMFATSLIVAAMLLFVPLTKTHAGILVVILTMVLLIGGIHTSIAMMMAGLLGLVNLGGMRVVSDAFQSGPFHTTASWSMSVVPMFVLMGIVMWRTGLTSQVFNAARLWVGKAPGGLAVATNFSGAGLAAASGSTIGISYALGRMAIPEMLKAGYKPSLATGVVAMSGSLGMLIPPSVILVIYAGVAEVAVGPQLLAAIVPGTIMAVLFGLLIMVRVVLKPSLAPKVDMTGVTWAERFRSLTGVIPVLVVVLVIIGGMFTGFFTATEAGAFGALAAIILGWIFGDGRKNGTFIRQITQSLKETVAAVAAIFLLLIGVALLTRAVTISGITRDLTNWVIELGLSRTSFLLVLLLVFLLMGMFMESMAIILLATPILAPVLVAMDVDMLWFGVFVVILVELAMVTPPVGMLTFIIHRLAQDKEVNLGHKISLVDVFKGVLPFVGITLVLLIVMIYFPDWVTWLPSISSAQ